MTAPVNSADAPERPLARLRSLVVANWRVVVVAVCLTVFLGLLGKVHGGQILSIDRLATALIVERLRAPWLTPLMETFSALATPAVLIVILLVISAFAPGRRPGMCCALNLVLCTALNLVLKALVQRPRPDEALRLVEVGGFSFPSGHSMAAMAFFGLIVWMVWHAEPNRTRRLALCAAFSLVIVLIGVSRIYLGVHYASDVVGGFCASLIWLALYTRLIAPLLLRFPVEEALRG